jgi:hypothetical protein
MAYHCPKCDRYGRQWDTEARALTCCYNPCRTVIHIADHRSMPNLERLAPVAEQRPRTLPNALPDGSMCPY